MKLQTLLLGVALTAGPIQAEQMVNVVVAPVGLTGVTFQLRESGAARMPDGILYRGDASVVTPLGHVVLAASDLWFGYAPGTQQVDTVRGRAYVPTPLSEQEVSIDEPVMAEVGYDRGSNLKDMGVPLMDDRGYLFFKFDAGLVMRVGKAPPEDLEEEEDRSFTITFPAGATARILFDPLDPMFYYAGGVTLPNRSKKQEDQEGGEEGQDGKQKEDETEEGGIETGSGFSKQGLFPFRPLVTWGIEDQAREFMGHRITTGTIPLFALPVTVRGHIITNLNPMAKGELAIDPLGIGFGPVAQAGANGRFTFTADLLKAVDVGGIFNLSIPLGAATAAVEIVNNRQMAYISGVTTPGNDFGMGLLLKHEGELKAAALVSSEVEQSRILLEGKYRVGVSEFGRMMGIDTGDLVRADAMMRLDRTGLFLLGQTETGVYAGPVTAGGALRVEMQVPADKPERQYLQLNGRMQFVGLGMEGVSRFSPNGIAVAGEVKEGDFEMSLQGGVAVEQHQPPYVHGKTSVPAGLQPDMHREIRRLAAGVKEELDRTLSSYEQATRDFEFELSLRGMRTVVPPVAEAIIREIDRQIPANINARWPKVNIPFVGNVEAPGKSTAIAEANRQAEPHRVRLRTLAARMRSRDDDAVRAALEAAIRGVLANPRIHITYRVPVTGTTFTVVDHTYVDAQLRNRLNTALAAVQAIPAASDRKVRAEQLWNQMPKREVLLNTAEAIEKGITNAIPRIDAIGFRFPLGRAEWEFLADVTAGGRKSTVTVRLTPDRIRSLGGLIGQVLGQGL